MAQPLKFRHNLFSTAISRVFRCWSSIDNIHAHTLTRTHGPHSRPAQIRPAHFQPSSVITACSVGTITLVDSAPVQIADVGVNFFIHEQDIAAGKSRAEVRV